MAYGGPAGEDDNVAVAAGLWSEGAYTADTEQIPGGEALAPGGSVGRYGETLSNGLDDWVIYTPGGTTPGAPNPAPAPFFRTPPDGIHTTDRRIPFGWSTVPGAAGYQFQLATGAFFSSPLVDEVLSTTTWAPDDDLNDGTYYYRVRSRHPDGSHSAYSGVGQVTVFAVSRGAGRAGTGPDETYWLNVDPQLQHKDSRMLCVDGHKRTGNDRWDSAHEDDGDWQVGNGKAQRSNKHDEWYCTRASIAMIVDYHGGALSQDRISYHEYDGNSPEGELGHGRGMWPDELCTWGRGTVGDNDVFTWAMNGGHIDCGRGKPSFDQIKAWIDDERPLLVVENNDAHSVVLDGYNTEGNLARRIDPWTATTSWVSYASWNITEYHCPEANTPRSNEDEFYRDSDGDGIVDFDETNRFRTSPVLADSDRDWLHDKWDLHEVYFDAAGDYSLNASGADMDGDGFRKEEDEDNDGGGAIDGCEDADLDGQRDAGETSNFDASDDVPCVPTLDKVYTTDLAGNRKSFFQPGEALLLVMRATNHTAGDLPVWFEWRTSDPNGAGVGYLSREPWLTLMVPGQEDFWLDRGIALDASLGTYTYAGTLSYGDRDRLGSTTFGVQGAAIPARLAVGLTCQDVVENRAVGVTDQFTPDDARVYAWTAWEGATGAHTVKFEWYLPEGAFWWEYSHPFNSAEALYYVWSWAEGAALYQEGRYEVKVYLDGAHVKTLAFTVSQPTHVGAAGTMPGSPWGGGGGAP